MVDDDACHVIAISAGDQTEAISFLPEDHSGPCAMSYRCRHGVEWAIFPGLQEGQRACAFAVRIDVGGYSDVQLHAKEAAPRQAPTYHNAWAWLDDDGHPICDVD